MITEVVVGVAKHDVKCHSVIEFAEILTHIGTPTKDEISFSFDFVFVFHDSAIEASFMALAAPSVSE